MPSATNYSKHGAVTSLVPSPMLRPEIDEKEETVSDRPLEGDGGHGGVHAEKRSRGQVAAKTVILFLPSNG